MNWLTLHRQVVALSLLIVATVPAFAQRNDFSTQFEANYTYKVIKAINIEVSEELALRDNSTRFSHSETMLALSVSLLRERMKQYGIKLKAEGGYSYSYRQNKELRCYSRHRIIVGLNANKRFGDWEIKNRLRLLGTYNMGHLSKRVNPSLYLRNRLTLSYSPKTKPWKIYISEEFNYLANDPSKKIIDDWRTRIGIDYKIDRTNEIGIFFRIKNETNVKKPDNIYTLGLEYAF